MSCDNSDNVEDLLEKSIDEKYPMKNKNKRKKCPFINFNAKEKPKWNHKVNRSVNKVEEKAKFNPLLLPEGWVRLFHESGMFFYCHVSTKVVTWSMPYQLQTEPPRYHRVPVRSIPCLSFTFSKTNNIDNLESLNEEVAETKPVETTTNDSLPNHTEAVAVAANYEPNESVSSLDVPNETKQEVKDIEDGEIESSDESDSGSKPNVKEFALPKRYQIDKSNHKSNRLKLNSMSEVRRTHSPPSLPKRRKIVSSSDPNSSVKPTGFPDNHHINNTTQQTPNPNPNENLSPLEPVDLTTKLLEPEQLRTYCKKLFTFVEEIKYVPRFFFVKKKPLKPDAKNNTITQSPIKSSEPSTQPPVENPSYEKMVSINCTEKLKIPNKNIHIDLAGRNFSCILNMYCQNAFGVTPTFQSNSSLSGIHDFEVACDISGTAYAVGEGRTKKIAKQKAVIKTLEILIPGFFAKVSIVNDKPAPKPSVSAPSTSQVTNTSANTTDRADGEIYMIFDNMDITDPRVLSYATKLNSMTPYNMLIECMNRHCVLDSHLESTIAKQNRHNVYKLKLGDKEVQANCENKREGRQLASQYMLAKLHPHIQRWGGILRLYGPDSKPVRRFDMHEMQNLLLEDRGGVKNNLINLLRKKMLELNEEWQLTNKTHAKFRVPFDNIPIIVFHPDSKEAPK